MLHSELERLAKAEEERQKNYNLELAAFEKVIKEQEAKLTDYSLQAVKARTSYETRISTLNRPISIVGPLLSQATTAISSIEPHPTLKKSDTRQLLKY